MTPQSWSLDHFQECKRLAGIEYTLEKEALENASQDFGALVKGHCSGVLFPRSVDEIQFLVTYANERNLMFAVRGKGYSQGGQTLPVHGSAVLDCSQLIRIDQPNLKALTLKCESGATWEAILVKTVPHGLIPKVMPLFPGLTVGGTISVGGIGANSHIYGAVASNVVELEVITGTGSYKKCSMESESLLFQTTLAGLGRCGVIGTATLALRPYKPNVRTYYLLYNNHKTWLMDQNTLSKTAACDYLEALCTASLQGMRKVGADWQPLSHWKYNLQVSFEDDESGNDAFLKTINALHHDHLLYCGEAGTIDFLTRYRMRIESIKRAGNLQSPHPWVEYFLPFEVADEILPQLLDKIPLTIGDGLGHRIFNLKNDHLNYFMKPSGEVAVVFTIVPLEVKLNNLNNFLQTMREIDEWLLSLGCKRSLPGWFDDMHKGKWEKHYGAQYSAWKEAKEKYDLKGVLQSVLLSA